MAKRSRSNGIPQKELDEASLRNFVHYIIHAYLQKKHGIIFKKANATENDYAVLYFDLDKLDFFRKSKQGKAKKFPVPIVEYFSEKKRAVPLLQGNPMSILAWKYSPDLELMI